MARPKPDRDDETEELMRQIREELIVLRQEVAKLHTVHEVRFSWPMDHEVLRILNLLEGRAEAGGLSPAEEAGLAKKLDAASGPLQEAVNDHK